MAKIKFIVATSRQEIGRKQFLIAYAQLKRKPLI